MNGLSTLNRFHPLVLAITAVIASAAHAEEATSIQTLPTIVVTAEDSAVTEGTNSYTTKSTNTSTKLDLSLRETPQTVIVYTRDYLDDRNIQSFQELLTNVTGVSVSRTDERQGAAARGFAVDYYLVDGMPSTLTLGAGDPDLSIYDRVEVVKGANGLMTGAGNPAMGLNMIRKRANSKELTGNVSVSGGSWGAYSTSADISTPLNADGSLRGRIFVKHSDEDSFMDFYSKERNVAYGTVDYDLTDKTNISIGATYQELNRDGVRWGGLPAFYTDGTRTNFDQSLIVSSDWTSWDINSTGLFASIKQNIINDVNLNLAYSYRRDDAKSFIFYTAGQVDKATNTLPIENASVYKDNVRNDENNVDLYISAPFTLAGRKQEIVFGGSWNRKETKTNDFGQTFDATSVNITRQNLIDLLGTNVLNFNSMNTRLLKNLDMNRKNDLNETTQSAGYISGKFHLLDPLKAVAGVRVSNWKFSAEDTNGDGTVAADREFKNEVTPYVGLIFDFAKNYSLYASYTSIFKPQSQRNLQGEYLDPTVGDSYETGIKAEFFDGRLNAGLALFRIEQDNVADRVLNEKGERVKIPGTAEDAYYNAKGVESEGVELNVSGEINENWALNFGIANFDAKDAKGNAIRPTDSRTTSNIFVKYTNEAWSAGAGLNYYSDIYTGTGKNLITRDDLYVASAMVGYKFDQNFSTQLNINNIFDKEYYEGIGANSMNYAAPRNATLTLRYKF